MKLCGWRVRRNIERAPLREAWAKMHHSRLAPVFVIKPKSGTPTDRMRRRVAAGYEARKNPLDFRNAQDAMAYLAAVDRIRKRMQS